MPRRRTYIAGVASAVTALLAGCSSTDETDESATASTENATSTPAATETDTPTPAATETENSTSVDEILDPPGPSEGGSLETETESPEA